ncbi:hypothetical protein D3C71_498010 [compost metagenome]
MRGYLDNEGAQTRYRVDGGEVFDDYWDTSTDGSGVFSPTPGIFARRLAAGNRVVIQAEKYDGSPVTYSFGLAGSGAVIGRVMSDCGLPVQDPHMIDGSIWLRVVDDLDRAHPDDVEPVQNMLNDLFRDKQITDRPGRKGQSTYERLSAFYAAYWHLCADAADPPSAACEMWKRRKEYDADADYGVEAVPLLIQYMEATLKKAREAASEGSTEAKP